MKIILTLFVFVISVNLFGQTRSEIIVTMNEYSENKGKVPYNINFTEEKLNAALIKLQSLTCKAGDEKLFDSFLEMILKTTGSANEVPADVLAEIFICRTELVENRLNGKYKNDFLTELLEFGFKNITHQNKIANQSELEKRIKKLKK